MAWNDPFARPGCSNQPPGPARTPRPVQIEPMSRITVRAGHSGGPRREMRRTTVELPFSELNPSMTSPAGQALTACSAVLQRLSVAERDVALANLLAKFGTQTG